MNIGLIGLGVMGGAYAKHLLKNKFVCYGIDPDQKNLSKFIELGGFEISYIDLFNKVDVILTSLPSLKSYQEVLNKIKEAKINLKKIIILDMNTISIEDKNIFKKDVKGLNIEVLDTPVSGTGAQAWQGDLTVFASGDKSLINKHIPIFDTFSKELINVGAFGNGMK